jgi:hypothetical protein
MDVCPFVVSIVGIETYYIAPYALVVVLHYHVGDHCSRFAIPLTIRVAN